jgi:hypothetical protein
VFEVRALDVLDGRRVVTISGYFDDLDSAVKGIITVSIAGASGIYVTLNPVNPALLARAANRMRIVKSGETTGDREIVRRRWLLVDCDPDRPSGISSTEEEKMRASARALEVRDALSRRGWPEPILADSGNGFHLLYRIDLPTDDGGLVKRVLESLAFHHSGGGVKVDVSVHNAARICKLYGTVARKGDSTATRPHRLSHLVEEPALGMEIVPRELLEALASEIPKPASGRKRNGTSSSFDLERWIADHGLAVGGPEPWQDGRKWIFSACPFDPSHTNRSAYIVQHASGVIAAGCHHASCQGKVWRDLRLLYEPGAYDERRGGEQGDGSAEEPPRDGVGASEDIDWPEMKPLPIALPDVPTMPRGLLPESLRSWLVDAAERLQVPLEMVAAPAIVTAGSVIGRSVAIRPKRQDDWLVVPNLWGAIVGRPGMLKTPAVREAMRFISALAAKASEEHREAMKAAKLEQEMIKLKIEELKNRATRKGGDPEAVKGELAALYEARDAALPIEKRYVTQDATVEKIGELLRDNPRGILMERDELAGWLRLLDRPGREGEREFYLESWDGTNSFVFDRIVRGTVPIAALALSILGTIQPSKLRAYITDAVNEGRGDDGLLQRFQLLVWPDAPSEFENVDRWPETRAREIARRVFIELDKIEGQKIGAHAERGGGSNEIPFLRFDDEAQELFNEWREELERRIRSPEMEATPAYESHIAKFRSLMPSLALVFHLIEVVAGKTTATAVELEPTKKAAAWTDFLDAHARRVYAVELDPMKQPMLALSEKIAAGVIRDGESVRDLYRPQWSDLRTPEAVERGFLALEELGRVRIVELDTAGAPKRIVRLHPRLRKPKNGPEQKTNGGFP